MIIIIKRSNLRKLDQYLRRAGGLTTQKSEQYVVFTLDERAFCLPLFQVERVINICEVTPLPQAPEIVSGVINLGGEILPVVNVRKRFRLPEREVILSDQLIAAHTQKRKVCLWVDTVTGVIESPQNLITTSEKILPHMDYVKGIIRLTDNLILIHDLEAFLSLEEETALDSAVTRYRGKT